MPCLGTIPDPERKPTALDSHCCSSVQFSPLLQAVPGPHAEGYCQWLSRAGKAVGGKNTSLCAVKDLKILGCYKGLSLTLSFCAQSQVSFCCHTGLYKCLTYDASQGLATCYAVDHCASRHYCASMQQSLSACSARPHAHTWVGMRSSRRMMLQKYQ